MSGALNVLMGGQGKPFEVSIYPLSIYQEGTTLTITTAQTAGVTVTGGTGPFTYAWTEVEDDIHATTPSVSTTKFTTTGLGLDDQRSGTFTCQVTDTATGLIGEASLSVTIRRV